jgi:DNA-binding winged helix-turn-helix (wHTH) protein
LEEIALTPKASAILLHLLTNPRRLVSKNELLRAVWGESRISPVTLRSTLRGLREALDEAPGAPA